MRHSPDSFVRRSDRHDDPVILILECSDEARKDKAEKCKTARNLCAPAINNHGSYGRWAFMEITNPWDAEKPPTYRAGVRCN
jgi:type III restriction enzyme